MKLSKGCSRGFTLIEILIVIAIMGALASIAVPAYTKYIERAQSTACLAERDVTDKMIMLYCNDNPDTELKSLSQLVGKGYLDSEPKCPYGGEYLLVSADATDSGYPEVGCSLHHWPAPGGGEEEPAEGIVADWGMNEGKGDITGKGEYTGKIHGAKWVKGKAGSALSFDGKDDYVKIPDNDALDLSEKGTLQAWVNMDSIGRYDGIIHKGNKRDFSDEAYSLQFWPGNKIMLGLVGENGKTLTLQTKTRFKTDGWHHVAATWDKDGRKIYVDGKLDNSTKKTTVARNTSGDVQIGAQLDENYNKRYKNFGFDGTIDEVAIYNTSLTAEEIATYYMETNISTNESKPYKKEFKVKAAQPYQ